MDDLRLVLKAARSAQENKRRWYVGLRFVDVSISTNVLRRHRQRPA